MFRWNVRLRGREGSLLWGYRQAATVGEWSITKAQVPKGQPPRWQLCATVKQSDAFQLRQKPLLFSAPRDKGMWCWGVEGDVQIAGGKLIVQLGQPEQ